MCSKICKKYRKNFCEKHFAKDPANPLYLEDLCEQPWAKENIILSKMQINAFIIEFLEHCVEYKTFKKYISERGSLALEEST